MKQIYDNKDIGEMIDKSFDAGIKEGYRRCREQMMKEAVEAEIQMQWDSFNHHLVEYGDEQEEIVWLNWNSFEDVCRDLYKLGLKARNEE